MPPYIVKQPNGKFARFSTIVDHFTHYDMLNPTDAGDGFYGEANRFGPQTFKEALETVFLVHGPGEYNATRKWFGMKTLSRKSNLYKSLLKRRGR